MPVIKKNRTSKKKVDRPFTKKQGVSAAFKKKIDKANKMLEEIVFLKKPSGC
ncbi:hypothetical protein [Chitinophaga barathri]|uniref:hypothetical protein n=1 Tax=Chitinophaga barathri TaxID=1647451 RepID=UPI0013C49CD6|nr:hypothetical protein [Chitinophaga barathri]